MDKFQLKSQFSENTIKVGSQLDHIWTNVLGNKWKHSFFFVIHWKFVW
jgi:hypothetical protein